MLIFPILRPLLQFALGQFFEKISVTGDPVESGPLLIVANHPDLALDAMVVSSAYKRPLWYLAKATIFQNPLLGAFLRSMHITPLFRRRDDPALMSNNEESFRAVLENFKLARAVLIFPEGTSLGDRMLKPIKTGAARMVMQARDAGLAIKIQPVGLTYTDLTRFASSVAITVGKSFDVSDIADSGPEGVRVLTERIEEEIRAVSVDIKTKEHEWLVENIARLYRSQSGGSDEHERFRLIAQNVEMLAPKLVGKREQIEKNLRGYLALCDLFGFDGGESFSRKISPVLQVLCASLAAIGVVIYWIPYRLVGIISNRRSGDPVYLHSTKFLFGTALFLVWIVALSACVYLIFSSLTAALVGFLSFVVVGVITNRFMGPLRVAFLRKFWPGKASPIAHLAQMRDGIIAELEALRVV